MFPLTNKEPYIKPSGVRTTLGELFAQAGGDISELEQEVNDLTQALTDETKTRAALGAHNLNGTVYKDTTNQGVTFTVNTNDSINIERVSTSSNDAYISYEPFVAPFDAQVILSGGADPNAYLYGFDDTLLSRPYTDSTKTTIQTGTDGNVYANNESSFYMVKGHTYHIVIRVAPAFTGSKTAKPLLRLATDSDTTYQPYAMTNQELTSKLNPLLVSHLPSNADLNNYVSEGAYWFNATDSTTMSHVPTANEGGHLDVKLTQTGNVERVAQIIYANSTIPGFYMRTNYGGSWSSWYKFQGTAI